MYEVSQTQPLPEHSPPFHLEPQPLSDEQRIAKHLGPEFRITPIGSKRFRCNKYFCPGGLYPTGRLAETLVLRVTTSGIEHLSDQEARSDRFRPW
jgi:hypothetical protein